MTLSDTKRYRVPRSVQVFLVRPRESQLPETTSSAASVSNLEILLLQRTTQRGGFWQPVTGRVEPGEDWATTARREVGEETGLAPESGRLLDLGYTHSYPLQPEWLVNYPPGTTHNDEAAFALLVPPGTPITHDPDEHSGCEWVSYETAVDRLVWHGNREALRRLPASLGKIRPTYDWQVADRKLRLGERTLVMGILNLTPDSFSDGGRFPTVEAAIDRALLLQTEGADVIDLGGESTRPGSTPVSTDEELNRIIPVLEGLQGRLTIPISIDTYKSKVAAAALQRGAAIVNDISGLRFDPPLAQVVKDFQAGLILMHSLGRPGSLHGHDPQPQIIGEIETGWRASLAAAGEAGIARASLVLDPGFGFGKNGAENVTLLAQLDQLHQFGYPLLVGTSRKSFLGKLIGKTDPADRNWATAASVTAAILQGAHLIRVHEVAPMRDCAAVADALLSEGGWGLTTKGGKLSNTT